jgi:pimeloyl-ACP methyl ester carboxylesterase
MATPAEAATTVARPEIEKERGRGHIGLVVLGSIAGGLALGLVLVLVVFAGGREDVITGAALIALAFGMLMLVGLARWRTDQPQSWAFVPALGIGVAGLAILILGPGDRVLGRLGWVWPLLLALVVVWSIRGARRSLHNWSRRALLYPAFAVLALVAVGGAFETVMEAATSNNPPSGGRTYVVADHSLYLRCTGSGSPAVILFNGLGERTPSWAWVQGDVERQTRVCAFDRAGQGWSGKAPGRQDAHELSADVRGLLAAANVPGPYVLAGHSVGGTYALAYAMDYPKDVAGVALLDSSTPYQFDLSAYRSFYSLWRRASALLPTLARAGVARAYSFVSFSSFPSDARRALRAFSSSPRELRADRDEFAELPTVFRQDKALTSLGGKPLFVLTADLGQLSGWPAAQKRLAGLSTNSVHRTTQGATHAALLEDRNYAAVSSRAIDAVVRSVRTGGPLAR